MSFERFVKIPNRLTFKTMKTKLLFTLIFTLSFFGISHAQETDSILIFRGKVFEVDTEIPLLGVNVYAADDPTNGTSTDLKGSFKLEIQSLPAQIVFSFIGYESDTILFENPRRRYKKMYLKPEVFDLPGIEITAKLELERLSDKLFSIRDFLMLDNEQILYLKKEGEIRGWEIILATLDGYVLDTFSLKKRYIRGPDFLHKSCLGNIHLLTYQGAYQLNIEDGKIVMSDSYARSKFNRLVLPCIESSEHYVYLKRKSYGGLGAEFKIAHKEGLFNRRFRMISDHNQQNRYRDDARYAALYEEMAKKTSLQFNDGLENTYRQFQLEMRFRQRSFSNGIDIPIFKLGDSLLIFNYYDHEIEFFNLEGKRDVEKRVNIDFHLYKKWEKVIFDKADGKLYAVFNSRKGKYIAEIDIQTGKIKNPLHFDCIFVRKISVHDGFLYLLHGEVHERNWVLYKVKF